MTGIYLVASLVALAFIMSVNLILRSSVFKLVMISYTFVVASLVYFSFETYKGWPTVDRSEDGQVIAVAMIEPRGPTPGAIYFWVMSTSREPSWVEKLYTYESDLPDAPRAHYLPYSKEAADAFRQAEEALKKGLMVTIEGGSVSGKNNGKDTDGTGEAEGEAEEGDSKVDKYDVPRLKIVSPQDFLKKE